MVGSIGSQDLKMEEKLKSMQVYLEFVGTSELYKAKETAYFRLVQFSGEQRSTSKSAFSQNTFS